jgi:membrane protein DedA with SNARE-associated domain
MEVIFGWISTYGYAALFALLVTGIVGLPIPEETMLVFCGYLISKGKLHPAATLGAAVAGSWCGISASYWIGRTLGLGVVHKFGKYLHVTDAQLAAVHGWFDRRGHWALFFGYYIAGVRHVTAVIAGASKLEFPSFLLYAWSGGLVWVSAFLTLGYVIGERWREIAELVHSYMRVVGFAVVVIGLAYWYFRPRSSSASPTEDAVPTSDAVASPETPRRS